MTPHEGIRMPPPLLLVIHGWFLKAVRECEVIIVKWLLANLPLFLGTNTISAIWVLYWVQVPEKSESQINIISLPMCAPNCSCLTSSSFLQATLVEFSVFVEKLQ